MRNEISPKVTNFSWGQIQIEGNRVFKDAKLFPGGAREWDWKETGTEHVPGIQLADVEELLSHGAKIVILSKGMLNRLQVCPETMQWLNQTGSAVHVLQSEEAVKLYNELAAEKPVAALIHTTCWDHFRNSRQKTRASNLILVELHILAGAVELEQPLLHRYSWTFILRRPISIGEICDKVEALISTKNNDRPGQGT
jgi:hypothetical protein